jgi:Protein of unknown function (DUF3072)
MAADPKSADWVAGRHEDPPEVTNPKAGPAPPAEQGEDPEEWAIGLEPMSPAQADYLKDLSQKAHEPEAYDPELDKAEAAKRIDQLKGETGV